jgi:Tfp pilus assembly protein FimT
LRKRKVITIAILGILIAIAIIVFLVLLEWWRVNTAADQLAADMRLAHTNATNQLPEWRLILIPEVADESTGPDYYLVKSDGSDCIRRLFSANVKIENHNSALNDDPVIVPACAPSPPYMIRKAQFNTDGTMAFTSGPSGSACVTVDDNLKLRVIVLSATSRVRIEDRSGKTCVP